MNSKFKRNVRNGKQEMQMFWWNIYSSAFKSLDPCKLKI